MKGLISGLVAGTVLGGAIGLTLGIFASPALLGTGPAAQGSGERDRGGLVGSGVFTQADPEDPLHWGTGGFDLYAGQLRLHADFAVGPGPKYHVYLSPDPRVGPHTPVYDSMFIDLGRLQAFAGTQRYPVPAGVDARAYPTVVIWSEQLQELISAGAVQAVD
jgi:hypothetical protein